MWALELYGIEQLLCDFEFLVLVLRSFHKFSIIANDVKV